LLLRSEVTQIVELFIHSKIDKIKDVDRDVRQVFLKASNFKLTYEKTGGIVSPA